MKTIEDAKRILGKAEDSLRKLVAQAASNGEYETVVVLADWAKSLNELTHDTEDPLSPPAPYPSTPRNGRNNPPMSRPQGTRERGKKYPQFFRDSDSLIKVAWSKTSKAEYEHKAPWLVARRLISALVQASVKNQLISMDEVLPLNHGDGDEIPSYQSYLCLAWFRELGLLRQHGRRGYSIKPGCDLDRDVATAWGVISKRSKL